MPTLYGNDNENTLRRVLAGYCSRMIRDGLKNGLAVGFQLRFGHDVFAIRVNFLKIGHDILQIRGFSLLQRQFAVTIGVRFGKRGRIRDSTRSQTNQQCGQGNAFD